MLAMFWIDIDGFGEGVTLSSRGVAARQKILEESAKAFARFGYDGARLDRIAATQDVTRQALLFHFKSKRGLYDATLEYLFEQREEGLDSRCRDDFEYLADYVDYLVEYSVDYYLKNPEYIRLLLRLLMAEGPSAGQAPVSGKGMVGRWEAVLKEGGKVGGIRVVPVSNLISVVGGTLSYFMLLPHGARTGADLMEYDPESPGEKAEITRGLQRAVRGLLGLSQPAGAEVPK